MIAHLHNGPAVVLTNYARYSYPTPRLTALVEGYRISPGCMFTYRDEHWVVTKATYLPVPMHIPNTQSSSDALLSFIVPVNTQITAKPMNKQYYYRNGQPAKIISTHNPEPWTLLTEAPNGARLIHLPNGRYLHGPDGEHPFDVMDFPVGSLGQPKPSESTFDPTRPCRYRNGETPRILCTDRPVDVRPILSMDGEGVVRTHDPEGKCPADPSHDLLNTPRRLTFTTWANVLLGVSGLPYLVTFSTREAADKSPTTNCRLACVPVPVDCEEGEGLS